MKEAERAGGQVEPVVFEFDDNYVQPPEGPFYDETADLIIEDDVEVQLPAHEEDELDNGGTGVGSSGQPFDSAMETVLWMNSAGAGGTKLPNRARNEWLKLMKDDRYRLEECLAKWKSHRDMELTIMKAAVGDGSRIVNLQRAGKDPEPILLSYMPALDLIRKMFADVNNKKGFVLEPQVDNDPAFVGKHIIVPIIVYLDKTTLDGLGRVSAYPMYISLGNFSWEVYNQKSGMQLVALLPSVRGDADWPGPGYKPRSEGLKETCRFFMNWSMSIVFETTREASYTGFQVTDPNGAQHNAVPFIYVISKDLGEASSISGVRSNSCDSCLVPTTEMHLVTRANQGAYDARLEDDMWGVVQQMQRKRDERAPHARILELNKEHGIHFSEPWFWEWNYSDRFWNNVYSKMAPDDLHTIFGGILGHHFIGILGAVGRALPMGEPAFMSFMDVRLHQVYLKYRPSGLRLPSKKDFFTKPCNTPAYEWKAILQVLPLMVVGICKIRSKDVLADWNNTLAIESVEAQRAELTELQRRDVYDSAALAALDANSTGGENRLNKTELFTIFIPNLLVSPDRANDLLVRGWEQRRLLLQWMRSIPLLSELPTALALYFAGEAQLPPAQLRGLDLMGYLDDKLADRIEVVNSCYVVPHVGGRDRLQQARASADFHGSVVLSDLAFASDSPDDPVNHTWYGKAHMFFRAFERKSVWDNALRRRVPTKVPHELVFVRWYNEVGFLDATKCPQLEWARMPGRPEGTPYCQVLSISSIKSVEMMVPKHTFTHNKRLVYRNLYFR
ncbi:hypothetical protein KFL_010090040 [Klebsormidium nitens]|uniref:Uncharacterized protein n=1 Tax=Klebsormidium nitens TaxID=105231 RepID=A0A1Y1IVV6_KLENI|nr:hypothetical protein KFL_010090040 [Klebsormidium nitens]|eukprot:GAQ92408.1 hypothetical protein KFL_010090040 [Klebsormidium nitens]